MTLVIGTDEAGYGPNLGPLVIGATAWRVAAEPAAVEAVLAATAQTAAELTGAEVLWGDSKRIYRAGAGLADLERGVLVAAALAGAGEPAGWSDFAATLRADGGGPLAGVTMPRHHHDPACRKLAALVREPLVAAGVTLVAVRCRIVEPAEFNALLDQGLNKSDILSQATLGLAAAVAGDAAATEPLVIWCDRHGGRRRYAPLVSRGFGVPLVQPLVETPERSSYRFGADNLIEFAVGGEARLPVAVASMTAKYVRELAMLAFNELWQRRQPGLAATAGYPVDARRWRNEAAATVAAAGIPWDEVWRRA
ncbi:MAG: hypothetical protein ACKOCX_07210 [Planctomycetota bacterium]